MSDITLIDPSYAQIRYESDRLLNAANDGARTRTISGMKTSEINEILTTDAGWREWDGGGVANSYGYRAYTTRLGVAWFTDPAGRKHIRIAADRHGISGRHVSCVLGNGGTLKTCHPAIRVYPWLRSPVPAFVGTGDRGRLKQEKAFLGQIAENPANLAGWQMYSDWLADQGQTAAAESAWAIVVLLEQAMAANSEPAEA